MNITGTGVHGGVLHRSFLHLGDTGGDGDHDPRADAETVAVNFFNEVTQHGLRHIEVGNDAVFHRTDGGDIAGGATQHAFGIGTDGPDFARSRVECDDGRFT